MPYQTNLLPPFNQFKILAKTSCKSLFAEYFALILKLKSRSIIVVFHKCDCITKMQINRYLWWFFQKIITKKWINYHIDTFITISHALSSKNARLCFKTIRKRLITKAATVLWYSSSIYKIKCKIPKKMQCLAEMRAVGISALALAPQNIRSHIFSAFSQYLSQKAIIASVIRTWYSFTLP